MTITNRGSTPLSNRLNSDVNRQRYYFQESQPKSATEEKIYMNKLGRFNGSLKLYLLYLNGVSVKAECPEKVVDMLNNIRLLLTSEKQLSRESKLWLMLALDLANNKFGLLPTEIHKFYQDHLGEVAMGGFQSAYGTLSVKTSHDTKTLDNYQSNVNVLQVSGSSDSIISNHVPSLASQPDSNTSQSSSGFASDSSCQNSSINVNRDTSNNSGKHGRPILGVGARFNKNKSNDENVSNWRDKDHSGGWNDKQKNTGNWNDTKKSVSKSNKGWEHDDRFDTDYS